VLPQCQVHPNRRLGAAVPRVPRLPATRVTRDPARPTGLARDPLVHRGLVHTGVLKPGKAQGVQPVELRRLEAPPPAPPTAAQQVPHGRRAPVIFPYDTSRAAGSSPPPRVHRRGARYAGADT
jgi:hypothetical protein